MVREERGEAGVTHATRSSSSPPLRPPLPPPARAQQLPLKGYGQELVDQVMAKERRLLVVVMHVSPPVRRTIDHRVQHRRLESADATMRVVTTGKTTLRTALRFEWRCPMRDSRQYHRRRSGYRLSLPGRGARSLWEEGLSSATAGAALLDAGSL